MRVELLEVRIRKERGLFERRSKSYSFGWVGQRMFLRLSGTFECPKTGRSHVQGFFTGGLEHGMEGGGLLTSRQQ